MYFDNSSSLYLNGFSGMRLFGEKAMTLSENDYGFLSDSLKNFYVDSTKECVLKKIVS